VIKNDDVTALFMIITGYETANVITAIYRVPDVKTAYETRQFTFTLTRFFTRCFVKCTPSALARGVCVPNTNEKINITELYIT